MAVTLEYMLQQIADINDIGDVIALNDSQYNEIVENNKREIGLKLNLRANQLYNIKPTGWRAHITYKNDMLSNEPMVHNANQHAAYEIALVASALLGHTTYLNNKFIKHVSMDGGRRRSVRRRNRRRNSTRGRRRN